MNGRGSRGPSSIGHGFPSVFSQATTDITGPTLDVDIAKQYFKKVLTDTPVLDADGKVVDYVMPDLRDVDLVLAGMRGPDNGNDFTGAGMNKDGTFYPLSLQWRPYKADGRNVRRVSIAGDLNPDGTQQNRSYVGASSRIGNEYDLTAVKRTVQAVHRIEMRQHRRIPVIVSVKARTSFIPAEFERDVDAILVGYSISDQVLIETALGQHDPQGRLPMTSPKNMDAVEKQLEDVGEDMTPYRDSAGHVYSFGFGMSWKGVIRDRPDRGHRPHR
ncbi:MAG: glycoside hydrolase family 3 C-terminal domain-containing protein [Intrasporangium sp.]|uniref:glycoside hydrolase family 3 C-terminal domain-containing protein n=1 Tax=Intrasporangium sp. TaxID=1925024 RepID=UPI0026482521|nr:glycoside hydrolase family 3 C-terminal domain-containing protein [Intrasporangium sp.]MDN5796080.1 glycoside hydrolase family 3 C-terminal domain-containing protein [Intrasporangium sp.]